MIFLDKIAKNMRCDLTRESRERQDRRKKGKPAPLFFGPRRVPVRPPRDGKTEGMRAAAPKRGALCLNCTKNKKYL